MATVRVPALGQSATEAELLEWRVRPGDRVAAGDVVAVIETDKTEVEVVSPVAGMVATLHADPGAVLDVGAPLVEVGEAAPAPQRPAADVAASPRARALARDHGVDLASLAGSGPGGLVVTRDVPGAPPSAPAATWRGRPVRRRVPVAATHASMARHTTRAWHSTPHIVQLVDVDLGRLATRRSQWRADEGSLAAVTWTDLVVAATARVLAEHPEANAAWDDDAVVEFDRVHVGLAVSAGRGLVVPVLADADRRTLGELSVAIRAMAASGGGDDAMGTVTVSNLGAWGVRAGFPVLHAPEAMLVFVGEVAERPLVRDGRVVAGPGVTLSVAYDHRVLDGASAAVVTRALRDRLADPDPWLPE